MLTRASYIYRVWQKKLTPRVTFANVFAVLKILQNSRNASKSNVGIAVLSQHVYVCLFSIECSAYFIDSSIYL